MTAAPVSKATLKRVAVLSALYVWAYFFTAYIVAPVQSALLPSVVMSLLFLPHGVRLLSAWLYGWRSIAYLLPGALLCNLHFAGERAFAPDVLVGTMASLIAAPLAFAIIRTAFPQVRLSVGQTRLPTIIAVGILASVINLTALKAALGLATSEGAVILLGDTAGLLLSLAIVRASLHILAPRN